MKEEDKKAECIVNRIQGEMEDLVTWEDVELSTSQDHFLTTDFYNY